MASSALNSSDTMRLVMAVSAAVSIPLSITTGVVTQNALPAIGIIPNVSSGIFSLVALRRSLQQKAREEHAEMGLPRGIPLQRSSSKPGASTFVVDVLHALSLLAVLLPSWILSDRNYWHGSVAELAAYGTMPMLLNFIIHTWLSLDFVLGRWMALAYPTLCLYDCPHCQMRAHSHHGRGNRGEHVILLPGEDEDLYDDDAQNTGTTVRPSLEEEESSPKTALLEGH